MNRKHKVTIIMSDATMAEIGRNLALALIQRAHSRSNDDQKRVLLLQTELCAEWAHEREAATAKLEGPLGPTAGEMAAVERAAPAQKPEGK